MWLSSDSASVILRASYLALCQLASRGRGNRLAGQRVVAGPMGLRDGTEPASATIRNGQHDWQARPAPPPTTARSPALPASAVRPSVRPVRPVRVRPSSVRPIHSLGQGADGLRVTGHRPAAQQPSSPAAQQPSQQPGQQSPDSSPGPPPRASQVRPARAGAAAETAAGVRRASAWLDAAAAASAGQPASLRVNFAPA
jgi:hypothetical protein